MDRITDLATVLASVSAAVVAGVVVFRAVVPTAAADRMVRVEDWQAYAEGGRRTGSQDPEIVLIEFGDYQCPYCRLSSPHVRAIQRKHADRLAFIYRHYPLSSHSSAYEAAIAAECAGQQASFWPYHRLLYADSGWIGESTRLALTELAKQAGVSDLTEFIRCLDDNSNAIRAVAADQTAAQRLGVRGTPTFLVNGALYVGALDSLTFDDLFAEVIPRE